MRKSELPGPRRSPPCWRPRRSRAASGRPTRARRRRPRKRGPSSRGLPGRPPTPGSTSSRCCARTRPRSAAPRTAAAARGSRARPRCRRAARAASSSCTRWARSASRHTAGSTSRCRPSGAGARRRSRTPNAPGYTEIEASASDIELDAKTLGPQLLVIEVVGRPLVAGERVSLVYGAGAPGASTDRFAEHDSRFWFAVDGDGDGIRGILPDSPGVDVLAGEPAQLRVTLPSVARPGERVRGDAGAARCGGQRRDIRRRGRSSFPSRRPGSSSRRASRSRRPTAGTRRSSCSRAQPGVVRLRAEGPQGPDAARAIRSRSRRDGPRVLWGDLHGHSNFSDGTGTPEDYYVYARDVAGLDVAALTDHDHWGMLALDSHRRCGKRSSARRSASTSPAAS